MNAKDAETCKATTAKKAWKNRFAPFLRCTRPATRDGYCALHHPGAADAKREAALKREAETAALLRERRARETRREELAAKALDALAVPGVADVLHRAAHLIDVTDKQRTALLALADAAKGE